MNSTLCPCLASLLEEACKLDLPVKLRECGRSALTICKEARLAKLSKISTTDSDSCVCRCAFI